MITLKPTKNIWEVTTPEEATEVLCSSYGLVGAMSVALQREIQSYWNNDYNRASFWGKVRYNLIKKALNTITLLK